MISRVSLVFLMILPALSFAENTSGVFIGAGLGNDFLSLSTQGSEYSKFSNQGYIVEAGVQFGFGGLMSAEFGESTSVNKITSQTFMETGKMNFYSAKIGYNFGQIAIGAGYRKNNIVLKSLSLVNSNYLESTYAGGSPLGYINLNFHSNKFMRSTAEAQFLSAKLISDNLDLPEATMNSVLFSLKIFIFFD
ncbi:MAG: hypothetical protein ABL927_07130 [Bdellovibrionales bacterium]